MSTRLGPAWPPLMSRRPPHMSPEDEEIYRIWWPQHAHLAKEVYFDVGVGPGASSAVPPNAPTNYAGAWIHNTQKRIDMVAVLEREIWIIEFRHAATSNAVGRLLQYDLLWANDPPFPTPVKLFLVTNHYDADLALLSERARIAYHWV